MIMIAKMNRHCGLAHALPRILGAAAHPRRVPIWECRYGSVDLGGVHVGSAVALLADTPATSHVLGVVVFSRRVI
jgi:hypothetical protein